jgi:hypothetical protein
VSGHAAGHDAVALLAAQSRVRAVVRRVVWREFASVASPQLIEQVCEAVFKELHLCCSGCAEQAQEPAPSSPRGCRCR